jgi:hypothetical protein
MRVARGPRGWGTKVPEPNRTLDLKPTILTPLTMAAAIDRIDRLNRREQTLFDRIHERMVDWSRGYLWQVNQAFYRHFINTWDPVTARVQGLDRALPAAAIPLWQDVEADIVDASEEAVDDAYREGFLLILWDLYRRGAVSLDQLEDVAVPDEADTIDWLDAAALGGLGLAARVGRWAGLGAARTSLAIRSAIGRELSLNDTGMMVETLADQIGGRLAILAGSEMNRAFFDGQLLALQRMFGDEIDDYIEGSLWLSRMDGRVCQLCAVLHGTITDLKPIEDSHPGCRCRKVPILRPTEWGNPEARPVDYDAFAEWMLDE